MNVNNEDNLTLSRINLRRTSTSSSYKVSHLNSGETKKVHHGIHIELNRSPPKFLDDNKLKNIPSSFTEYIKPKNIYHKNTYNGKGSRSRSRPSTSSSGYKNYMKYVSYHNTTINDNNNLLKF